MHQNDHISQYICARRWHLLRCPISLDRPSGVQQVEHMGGCVCRWYDLVLAAEDDIATIMTMEGGKPLKESKGEFAAG